MDFVKPLKTKKAESQKTTLPINNPIIFKEDNVLFLKVLIRIWLKIISEELFFRHWPITQLSNIISPIP